MKDNLVFAKDNRSNKHNNFAISSDNLLPKNVPVYLLSNNMEIIFGNEKIYNIADNKKVM